jgi:excinuclease ABC subunit C
MPQSKKRLEELLIKANTLPLTPGVYIMKDKSDTVIYVGKSRKLKNRVSQYFQQSKKNFKTERMVYSAENFEYILCKTEIEALTIENTLIKKYNPKYNIKLKDAKSYPYIKITNDEYPRIIFSRTRANDKGKYYGPFSGNSIAYSILDILHKFLGIPNCKRKFPQDFGKERPCLYYQLNQCCGLCTGNVSKKDYLSLISCAKNILK